MFLLDFWTWQFGQGYPGERVSHIMPQSTVELCFIHIDVKFAIDVLDDSITIFKQYAAHQRSCNHSAMPSLKTHRPREMVKPLRHSTHQSTRGCRRALRQMRSRCVSMGVGL